MCRRDWWINVWPDREQEESRWLYCRHSRNDVPCEDARERYVGEFIMTAEGSQRPSTSNCCAPRLTVETTTTMRPSTSSSHGSGRGAEERMTVRRFVRSKSTSTPRSNKLKMPWEFLRPSSQPPQQTVIRRTITTETTPPRSGSRGSGGSHGTEYVVRRQSVSHSRSTSDDRRHTMYEIHVPPAAPSPRTSIRTASPPVVELVSPRRTSASSRYSMGGSVGLEERSPRPRSPTPQRHRRNDSATSHSPLRVSFDETDLEIRRRYRAEAAVRLAGDAQRLAEGEAERLRDAADAAERERIATEEENDRLRSQTATAARENARLRERHDATARAAAMIQRDNARLRNQRNRERDVNERERDINERLNRLNLTRSSTSPATGGIANPASPATGILRLRRESRNISPRIIQRGILVRRDHDQALMSGGLGEGSSSSSSSTSTPSGGPPPPRMGPMQRRGTEVLNQAREEAAQRLRREERERALRETSREERDRRRRARISYTEEDERRRRSTWE